MEKEKRFTTITVWVHFKVWLKLSFWPVILLVLACSFGMPVDLGKALGGIVLTLSIGIVLINFVCYIGKIDVPKIL